MIFPCISCEERRKKKRRLIDSFSLDMLIIMIFLDSILSVKPGVIQIFILCFSCCNYACDIPSRSLLLLW